MKWLRHPWSQETFSQLADLWLFLPKLYERENSIYGVLGLPGPPGELRKRFKIGLYNFQDVARYQMSVWRAQVEVHEAQVGSESGSWAGRKPPGPAGVMSRQVEKSLTRPDID